MDSAIIVGYGIVGQATAKLFGIKKHFDILEERSNCTLDEVANCRYVFICMPTPVENGSYVVNPILEMVREIEQRQKGPIYIIRSTVWPGFANHIFNEVRPQAVISNPEFLSEDTWEKDIKYPPFVLIGGAEGRFRDEIKTLYMNVNKQSKMILTDNITAEAIKLTMNAWFSAKVLFCNQIYDWCQQSGTNYEKIREVLEIHPFGMKNHTKIFYKEKRGVNGHCLPKDLEAFAHYTKLPLLEKLIEINNAIEH